MNPSNYLLPLPEIDWPSALAEWQWLLPEGCTPRSVSFFGDLFLASGSDVYLLDLENGTFARYCDVSEAIVVALAKDDDADLLLYAKLVDELRVNGHYLASGHCYHFKLPTVLGGEFTVANIGINTISERIRFCGDMHRQIKDLPDGASVSIDFTGD